MPPCPPTGQQRLARSHQTTRTEVFFNVCKATRSKDQTPVQRWLLSSVFPISPRSRQPTPQLTQIHAGSGRLTDTQQMSHTGSQFPSHGAEKATGEVHGLWQLLHLWMQSVHSKAQSLSVAQVMVCLPPSLLCPGCLCKQACLSCVRLLTLYKPVCLCSLPVFVPACL